MITVRNITLKEFIIDHFGQYRRKIGRLIINRNEKNSIPEIIDYIFEYTLVTTYFFQVG